MGWRKLFTCIRSSDETDITVAMEGKEMKRNNLDKSSTRHKTSETPRFMARITTCFNGKIIYTCKYSNLFCHLLIKLIRECAHDDYYNRGGYQLYKVNQQVRVFTL